MIVGVGLLIAGVGRLVGANVIVLAVMGTLGAQALIAKPTARGIAVRKQIAFEKSTKHWFNTNIEQS